MMKRSEIKEAMQKGELLVMYKDSVGIVLHPFTHYTWIAYKGYLWKVKHSELKLKEVRGEPTWIQDIHRKLRSDNGYSPNFLKQLVSKYCSKYNLKRSSVFGGAG